MDNDQHQNWLMIIKIYLQKGHRWAGEGESSHAICTRNEIIQYVTNDARQDSGNIINSTHHNNQFKVQKIKDHI